MTTSRTARFLGAALLLALAPLRASATPHVVPIEISVFVYDLFAAEPDCAHIRERLQALPLRSTVLLSVEQGPEFLPDSSAGQQRLRCALTFLRAHGRRVKALLLQDTTFLDTPNEAARRMAALARFSRSAGGFAGAVLDIEPYLHRDWECGTVGDRRALAMRYLELVKQVRRAVAPLTVEVAVPAWWAEQSEVPELQPEQLFRATDGVYVMLYGDPGGPLVGGSVERIAERIPASGGFFGSGSGSSAKRASQPRVHLVLAPYELSSPAEMEAQLAALRQRYAGARGFAGVSLFHAAATYNAPLVRMLSGSVLDERGERLHGATVVSAELKAESDDCGNFSLRDVKTEAVRLEVRKAGYRTASVEVKLAPAGQVTELPPIHLVAQNETDK